MSASTTSAPSRPPEGVDPPRILRGSLYTNVERKKLGPELLRTSRARGYAQVVGNIAVLLVLLALAGSATSVWQGVLLFLGIGLAQHRLFFPTHDCIHYSLFPARGENRACGVILSALLGTSFEAIRDQHMEHHREFGTEADPGASDYYVRFRSRSRLLIFLLGPLAGSILIVKIGDYLLRPARQAPPATPKASRGKAKFGGKLVRYGAILGVQLAVCAVLTRGFALHELWRYPVFNVLPAVTIFLFLVRLRMFLEHGSLNYAVCDYFERKRPTARTIYGSWFERVFVCGSDFNFHHEHHLYPVVPGWQLPALHRELLAAGLDPEDVRQTYAQALAEIWRNIPASSPRPGVASVHD
ncbi:MAG TPA: fatty acid desaturase [Polyangia bacterium]|jgi:fatty acid desaturase|nr:fatty acid desaturase [Polyangia bacterium]